VRKLVRRVSLMLLAVLLSAKDTSAATADLCDRAAHKAARQTGVPVEVLLALTRTETGRKTNGKFGPWPWAFNVAGKGYWFNDRHAAQSFADDLAARGVKNFDVGCFQINYRWHGAAFRDLQTMLDPDQNALYAAGFLSRLERETNDWTKAAAAYHSRTPKYAKKYRLRFERILASLDGKTAASTPALTFRNNAYPLLQRPAQVSMMPGSLVPLNDGATARPLFEREG
jgi:hypothetical protein